ncbi:unnamed protein product [Dicrocoelium dendriticum]|nr:unnamed protein product [Dicrocoelium dendriticum]
MTNADSSSVGEIKVSGLGFVIIEPDLCNFNFVIASTKGTVELANASAKKRYDYTEQELRNRRFKSANVVQKADVVHEDTVFTSIFVFDVSQADIEESRGLLQHLQAKLGRYFQLGDLSCYASEEKISTMRRSAVKMAVNDAKNKAEIIASAFGQRIRGLVRVTETETAIQSITEEERALPPRRSVLMDLSSAIRAARQRLCVRLDAVCALGEFTR